MQMVFTGAKVDYEGRGNFHISDSCCHVVNKLGVAICAACLFGAILAIGKHVITSVSTFLARSKQLPKCKAGLRQEVEQ